jgi:hypothetical protein
VSNDRQVTANLNIIVVDYRSGLKSIQNISRLHIVSQFNGVYIYKVYEWWNDYYVEPGSSVSLATD